MSVLLMCVLTGATFAADEAASHMSMEADEMHWDETSDAAFLSGMIVHHRGAVAMSEDILKTTALPEIRRWGTAIIGAQRREIGEMEALLKNVGGHDEAAAAEMEAEMDMMMARKASDDADVNFIELMVPHHAGAIDMALPALTMSDNPRIRKMAEDIIVAQAREIAEFRAWLAGREPSRMAQK
jgi:uncharacterized protein (DUF305 family)